MKLFFFVCVMASAETFTGVVTDTMCGAKHTMLKDAPDDKCIRACLKGSSEYALFDGETVFKLSDQKQPGKFAAQRVKVTGTLDQKTKTIKVGSIEPDEPKKPVARSQNEDTLVPVGRWEVF
jgi:hypothetical protein